MSVRKEGKIRFNYVTTFSKVVVFWSMRGRCEMRNTINGEIVGKGFIFHLPPIVREECWVSKYFSTRVLYRIKTFAVSDFFLSG